MPVFQRRSKMRRFSADRSKPLPKGRTFTIAPRGKGAGRFLMTLLFLLGGVAVLNFPTGGPMLRVGQVAKRDYRARVSFDARDDEATRRAREEAAAKTMHIFQENVDHMIRLPRDLEEFLKLVVEVRNSGTLLDRAHAEWGLPSEKFKWLKSHFDMNWMDRGLEVVKGAIEKAARRGIVAAVDRQNELDARRYEVKVASRGSDVATAVRSTYRAIDYPRGLREFFVSELVIWFRDKPLEFQDVFLDMLAHAAKPTLKPDNTATESAMRKARKDVPQQYRKIIKGSIILGAGDRVTRRALDEIALERTAFAALPQSARDRAGESKQTRKRILGALGLTGVLVVGFLVMAFYGFVFASDALTSNTRVFGVYAACLFTLLALRVLEYFALPLHIAPVVFAAIVLVVAAGPTLAFGATLFLTVLVGVASDGGLTLSASLLVGGAVGILMLIHVRRRTNPLEAGALAGLACAICVWVFHLAGLPAADGESIWPVSESLAGLGGGVLAGVVLTASLPYVERFFDVATDLRLLEWTDQNQPLLRKLALEAPGTYHHSTVVGNMAEAAAEAIGGNTLLARAGAYLHDIGKLNRPDYFIENSIGRSSRHDGLSSNMSTLILTAHTKDGAELAENYGVPSPLRRIILEHHGTSIAQYFYGKACKEAGDSDVRPAAADFRYRGPKPSSRESGIVMLADAVESASRALANPSPGRVESLVHEIVDNRLQDGQLDESRMSITDIRRVEASLTRSLAAVSHPRIRYPVA